MWPPLPGPVQTTLPVTDINTVQAGHVVVTGQQSAQSTDNSAVGNPPREVSLSPAEQLQSQAVAAGGCSSRDRATMSSDVNRFAPLASIAEC